MRVTSVGQADVVEGGEYALAADFTAKGPTPEHTRMVGGQMNKVNSIDTAVTA